MKDKQKPNPATDAAPSSASKQFFPLNPLVNMIGMASWVEMMKESSQFFSERLEKDLETQRELFNCKSLADVMRVQSDFYRNALEQYTAEFQRMAELWSKATDLGMIEATKPRARNYDDIPL